MTKAEAEKRLMRLLNEDQLADLKKTGCFNVRTEQITMKIDPTCSCEKCQRLTTYPGKLLRVSTHNEFPPAIDAGGMCRNAWPLEYSNAMERALGILIVLQGDPSIFFRVACTSGYSTDHMRRPGEDYAKADDYEGRL